MAPPHLSNVLYGKGDFWFLTVSEVIRLLGCSYRELHGLLLFVLVFVFIVVV